MRSIDGRLNNLEYRLGIARDAPRYLLIVMDAGRELGPADDAYIESLYEGGLLPTSGFGLVDLTHTPNGDDLGITPAAGIAIELE
jgi:hypothetical protein